MPSASAVSTASTSSNAFLAIFWGGLACGVLDITQACVAWGIQNHLPPQRIFQSVASGLLGPKSFQGGAETAALGLFLHFLIAFIWAGIYFIASRQIGFSYSKAGDRRAALRRVCLGYDELRGGAAFGHPSLAAKNRYGVNHYGTDLAYSPCGIADRAGGKPLGAKVDWQAANIPEMPNERDLALFGSIGKGWLWGNPESRQRNS